MTSLPHGPMANHSYEGSLTASTVTTLPSNLLSLVWSAEQVTFLDTRIYLKNGQIGIDLHVKPTERHQYLHMDSCHPKHCTILLYQPFIQPPNTIYIVSVLHTSE